MLMATVQAIARLTEMSNQKLVRQITTIAAHYGVTDSLHALVGHKPNMKDPAQSMLRERELMSAVLDEVLAKMTGDDATSDPAPAARRTNSTRKASTGATA